MAEEGNEVAPRLIDRIRNKRPGIGPARGHEEVTTDRAPIGGQHRFENAGENAVMETAAREMTPSGFMGPRGRYLPEYPGLKEYQAAGVPPTLAPYQPLDQLPKATALPPVPYQLSRYIDILTTANSGRLLDRDAGHPIHGMQVDNYSRIWLYVPAAGRYIPPYTFGIQMGIKDAANKMEVIASAPPVFTQAAASTTETFSITATECWLEYSPGISILNNPGGAATAVLVAGTQTPGDAIANPTDAVDTRTFLEVFNGTTWDRVREGVPLGSVLVDASGSRAATATNSNVASSATSVTILASNTSRKGASVYNDSTQILYLNLQGNAASTSNYTTQIGPQGFYELPPPAIYTGTITGIWASANGNARVTELT